MKLAHNRPIAKGDLKERPRTPEVRKAARRYIKATIIHIRKRQGTLHLSLKEIREIRLRRAKKLQS